jgi:hypothetical protein
MIAERSAVIYIFGPLRDNREKGLDMLAKERALYLWSSLLHYPLTTSN